MSVRERATIRALVALYDGRPEEAARDATAAIEAEPGLFTRAHEAEQIAAARAIRALAYAALGAAAEAKVDADAAESSVHATPEVIARARLVRALLASRAVYHEQALRAYVDANAKLVLEHAVPRERALFRALRRMARSPHRGVYRQPGKVHDDRVPSKLASWIAVVAPEAAAYVEGDRVLADRVDEAPIESGVPSDVRALRSARASTSSGPRGRHWLGLGMVGWTALAIGALGVVQLLAFPLDASSSSLASAPAAPTTAGDVLAAALLVGIVVAVTCIVFVSVAQRRQRALAIARRQVAVGERDRAIPALARLAMSAGALDAAAAGLELARIAASQADFAEAISRCDAAIARVSRPPMRAAASVYLLPALMTESAVALASRGGLEDADAELAILGRDFPSFPYLASSQLRVKLVRAVRAGDRETACAAARARTAEMPLPYREDVLCDLLLASRDEVGEEDLARLDAELRDDGELRRWLDAVAPGLRDERGLQGRRARIAVQAAEREAAARSSSAPAADAEAGESASPGATIKRVEANG